MSKYTQPSSPFHEFFDQSKPDELKLYGQWIEEFINRLMDIASKPIGFVNPKRVEEAQLDKFNENRVIYYVEKKLSTILEQEPKEQTVSLGAVKEIIETIEDPALKNLMLPREEGNALASLGILDEDTTNQFFFVVRIGELLESAFHETYLVQQGMAQELCRFILPEYPAGNAANLIEMAAESLVEARMFKMSSRQSQETRVVDEANIATAEIHYLFAVGQVFSEDGNRLYRKGGALLGEAPEASDTVYNKVLAAYQKAYDQPLEDGMDAVGKPLTLLENFEHELKNMLNRSEKVQFDRFYEQGLSKVNGQDQSPSR